MTQTEHATLTIAAKTRINNKKIYIQVKSPYLELKIIRRIQGDPTRQGEAKIRF